MGRRLPRRMWHTVAALVPLPLIALGYVAAAPGNPVAFEVELYLSGKGSDQPLSQRAKTSPERLPLAAAPLFRAKGKEPRADVRNTVTTAGKQLIAASLVGDPGVTGAVSPRGEVNGAAKADRLKPTTSAVALSSSPGGPDNSLMMMAASSFDTDSLRPSPEDIAYHPTPEALNFRYHGESQAEFETREKRCLAIAIYFEARGEPQRGQVAVGQVILNRVRSPLFPETICGVVYQGQMSPGCQFSFTCDGRTDVPRNDAQWRQAQDIASRITKGELWLPEVGYSTYYHADYVRPNWASSMSRIDTIGRHIFYKKRNEQPYVVEASAAPEPQAPQQAVLEPTPQQATLEPTPQQATLEPAPQPAALETAPSLFTLAPAVSLVAAADEGSNAPTPAMSLGFAASE
jgi:spore germination cell wall hydrolase CwlJ-like protein